MSNEFNHIEAFEAYYSNELSANARIDFEERLESDFDFKNEYDLYLQLQKAIEAHGDEQLKISLDEYHSEYINSQIKNKALLQFKTYLGGFTLVFIVIGLLLLFFPEETAHQRIEEHTAQIEVNTKTQQIVTKKYDNLITNNQDTLSTTSLTTTTIKVKTDLKKNITIIPLKKYITPTTPLYELNDSTLHLYGLNLKNSGYILSEQNNLYLITPNNSYLLEKSAEKKPLQKVKKRLYESIIKTKNQSLKTTKMHQVVFEETTDSITINFNEKLPKNLYSFDGTTINLSDSLHHQFQLISFESSIYLLNSENLYRLNRGVNQKKKPATQTEKNRLKLTTIELPILTETVEKSVEWENSN